MAIQRRTELMLVCTLLGVGIAAYLTYVAIWQHGEAFCTGVGDCQRVQTSEYSRVAGVPVAVLGLGMYLGLLALLMLRRLRPHWWLRQVTVWTATLALAGVAYSAYLTWLELAVIHAICVWCVASAVVIGVIALLAMPDVLRRRPEP